MVPGKVLTRWALSKPEAASATQLQCQALGMAGSHWLLVSVTLPESRAALLSGKQLALSRQSMTLRWRLGVVAVCRKLCSSMGASPGGLDNSSHSQAQLLCTCPCP